MRLAELGEFPAELEVERNFKEMVLTLVNLKILSRATFLVCKLTSRTCRLAYELSQSDRLATFKEMRAMDSSYFFISELSSTE